MLSTKKIQKLDYLEKINSWDQSQHIVNSWDYFERIFQKIYLCGILIDSPKYKISKYQDFRIVDSRN